jgi:stage V sporulation protein D (sporulation-specific penicillin-binding protein)
MTIADRIGREKFYEYFQAFGYNEKTGIDLPGESNPIYSTYSRFNTLELAVYSFGQTFKVTPIRQITAISAVANGGYLNTPYVVDKIVDGNGNIVMSRESTVKRQVISTEICNQITEILEQGVSTDGGAKNAYVAGYKIAAKTGTSEVRDELNEEGESIYRVGSCIGYAPADDPQIAVLIVVDKPQCENIYGAYVAAPYVASFMSEALPYIGVERNLTPEEEANLSTTLRNYVGLTVTEVATDLTNRGIKFTVYGTGEEVTYQIPAGGASINKATGKVYIYSGDARPDEKATVPDVMGRTAERAKQAIIGQGLNIVLEGATNLNAGQGAVVVSQTPAAGTQVDYGTVVTVVMRHIGDTDA